MRLSARAKVLLSSICSFVLGGSFIYALTNNKHGRPVRTSNNVLVERDTDSSPPSSSNSACPPSSSTTKHSEYDDVGLPEHCCPSSSHDGVHVLTPQFQFREREAYSLLYNIFTRQSDWVIEHFSSSSSSSPSKVIAHSNNQRGDDSKNNSNSKSKENDLSSTFVSSSSSSPSSSSSLVMEPLPSSSLSRGDREKASFHEDVSIVSPVRSHNSDFAHSGYDRGHMAAAADAAKKGQKALNETFLLSNISPQNQSFNRGYWNGFERFVRSLSTQFDDVYVVTGSLFLPSLQPHHHYHHHSPPPPSSSPPAAAPDGVSLAGESPCRFIGNEEQRLARRQTEAFVEEDSSNTNTNGFNQKHNNRKGKALSRQQTDTMHSSSPSSSSSSHCTHLLRKHFHLLNVLYDHYREWKITNTIFPSPVSSSSSSSSALSVDDSCHSSDCPHHGRPSNINAHHSIPSSSISLSSSSSTSPAFHALKTKMKPFVDRLFSHSSFSSSLSASPSSLPSSSSSSTPASSSSSSSSSSSLFEYFPPRPIPPATEFEYRIPVIGHYPCHYVSVPSHFYKVILAVKRHPVTTSSSSSSLASSATSLVTSSSSSSPSSLPSSSSSLSPIDEYYIAAFLLPHVYIPLSFPLSSFHVPLDFLECLSGYRYFPRLPQLQSAFGASSAAHALLLPSSSPSRSSNSVSITTNQSAATRSPSIDNHAHNNNNNNHNSQHLLCDHIPCRILSFRGSSNTRPQTS